MWGDQDSSGFGTVVGVSAVDDGWVQIRWPDGTKNGYRAGVSNDHDLVFAPVDGSGTGPVVDASASVPVTVELAKVGTKVVLGPDW